MTPDGNGLKATDAASPARHAPVRRVAAALLAVGLLATALFGIKAAWRRVFVDNFGVVEPGRIFRSGQPYPGQLDRLITKYNIRTVISLRETNAPERAAAHEAEVCNRRSVTLVRLPMPGDGCAVFSDLDAALSLLRETNNYPVLVHCARGTYRTGAVISSFRVLEQHWSEDSVFTEMEQYRLKRAPSHPIRAHLRRYWDERRRKSEGPNVLGQ